MRVAQIFSLLILSVLALFLLTLHFAVAQEIERPTQTATFSMYCYWTGEAALGEVPGVVRSRIGHQDGAEIVTVDYDSTSTGLEELVAALKRRRSFYALLAQDEEQQRQAERFLTTSEIVSASGSAHFIESKHSLRVKYPDLYYLDLTEEQAIALNTWSHFGGPMPTVLTPDQLARRKVLRQRFRSGKRPRGLAPDQARLGESRLSYREQLLEWLERS